MAQSIAVPTSSERTRWQRIKQNQLWHYLRQYWGRYVFGLLLLIFATGLGPGLVLWYGGLSVLDETFTLGNLVAFTQYMALFYWPLRELVQRYTTLQQAMASAERVFGVLDEPEKVADIEAPHHQGDQIFGKIEFRNVWFAYEPDSWILKDGPSPCSPVSGSPSSVPSAPARPRSFHCSSAVTTCSVAASSSTTFRSTSSLSVSCNATLP